MRSSNLIIKRATIWLQTLTILKSRLTFLRFPDMGFSSVFSLIIIFSLIILGKQTRQREPIASTTASGCPHLSESRDCSINSCYSWRLEQQDECFLPREIGRDCGSGTRKLLFACVDFDGVSNFRIRLHQLHTYLSL